tara:strand:- start:319 stop:507 length:189 start_codon:yes stop_codon:yes gene_type:complete
MAVSEPVFDEFNPIIHRRQAEVQAHFAGDYVANFLAMPNFSLIFIHFCTEFPVHCRPGGNHK